MSEQKRPAKPTPVKNAERESAPDLVLGSLTPEGSKFFNQAKRLTPAQHGGDPLGDLPMQSR